MEPPVSTSFSSASGPLVIGQDRAVASLTGALKADRLAHGLLFVGPDGVGRERTARGLARGLLCDLRGTPNESLPFGCGACRGCRRVESGSHPDLHIIMSEAEAVSRGLGDKDGKARPSAEIKIDAVRELGLRLLRRPYEGRASVAIIVDAHRMNEKAQNALLKVLEEPAPTTVLILIVPGARAVLPTIGSRCLRLAFSPLTEASLATILRRLQVPDADLRAARAREGASSVPAVMDDGEGSLRPAAEQVRGGLLLKQLGQDLGERLRVAESLGKDRLEVEAVIQATERSLITSLRARGGAPAPARELDEVLALDALAQARKDLRTNGNVQLVIDRLLCGTAPSVLEQRR
jgi:DNA polymerase-3 subunit delta'